MLETDIFNFVDDNTIYVCDGNLDQVITRLKHNTLRMMEWYKFNSMVANPAEFQIMFLGENIIEP